RGDAASRPVRRRLHGREVGSGGAAARCLGVYGRARNEPRRRSRSGGRAAAGCWAVGGTARSRTSLNRRPIAVAITGGIGAGKSETLRAFERHGAAAASSDAIVHRLLRGDHEVHAALRERWGERIVGPDGADRAAIADIVFSNPDELTWLEGLLHPRVVREYTAW